MKTLTLIAVPLALVAVGCDRAPDNATGTPSPKVAAVPPPSGLDWVSTTAATPEGGFVMGNPKAPIKLVEYGSMTCPHCAEFAEQGGDALKQLVSAGKVSWEYRPFVRDPVDVTATLLSRCGGPGPFFAMMEGMYEGQDGWFADRLPQLQAAMQAGQRETPAQQFTRYAQVTGLDQFVAQRGIGAAQASACLADKAATDRLLQIQDSAVKAGVNGTPAFMINGRLVPNAASWATLEPALRAAGA